MGSFLKTYALGFLALLIAILVRWLLDPVMGDTLPLVTIFGAVAAAVWIGGYRIAILVTLGEPIYLNADRARLAQLFGNLLNDSSKYTSAEGTISLTAKRIDGEVIVPVKDNGAGIPQDKLDSIFGYVYAGRSEF